MYKTSSGTIEGTGLGSVNRSRGRQHHSGRALDFGGLSAVIITEPPKAESRYRVFGMQVARRFIAGYLCRNDKEDSNMVEECSPRLWIDTPSSLVVTDAR